MPSKSIISVVQTDVVGSVSFVLSSFFICFCSIVPLVVNPLALISGVFSFKTELFASSNSSSVIPSIPLASFASNWNFTNLLSEPPATKLVLRVEFELAKSKVSPFASFAAFSPALSE